MIPGEEVEEPDDDFITQAESRRMFDEEDEFQRIMTETFANPAYVDQEINDLLALRHNIKNTNNNNHSLRPLRDNKGRQSPDDSHSQSSSAAPYQPDHASLYKSSEYSDAPIDESRYSDRDQFHSRRSSRSHQHHNNETNNNQSPLQRKPSNPIDLIQQQILNSASPLTVPEIQERFKLHLLNEHPSALNTKPLQLTESYMTSVPGHINAFVRDNKKVVQGVEIYLEQQERTCVLWTLSGEIVVFYPSSQRHFMFRPFDDGTRITCVKISPNLEYMVICSAGMELAAYRLRETIKIEKQETFRFLPKPLLFHTVSSKQLQANIVQVQFLGIEDGLSLLVLDEFDTISLLNIRKRIINYRNYLQPLNLTFQSAFMMRVGSCSYQSPQQPRVSNKISIVAVSSQEAVTLFTVHPKFQVMLVYQQSNREAVIKQGRIAHLDFFENDLMIVWDKYLQILRITIQEAEPLNYNMSALKHYFFAENSLAVGFLSDTLVYQFTRTGLRVYNTNRFRSGSYQPSQNRQMESAEIYFLELSTQSLPAESRLSAQLLCNPQPPMVELRRLYSSISTSLRSRQASTQQQHFQLMYVSQNQLHSLQFLSYMEYLSRKVDSEGHWKLGLNVLRRIYEGTLFELDCIRVRPFETDPRSPHYRVFRQITHDYVQRYLERFFVLVSKNSSSTSSLNITWNQKQIQKQELLFLCDFLIRTNNCSFMMDAVCTRCQALGLDFLSSLEPFILLKRVNNMGSENIDYYFQHYSKDTISKLIYSLNPDVNQLHLIKSHLIRHKMYAEFIYLCICEEDFYTPYVILMSCARETDSQVNSRQILYLLMYYMRKCIKGEKIHQGFLRSQTHRSVLKELVLKMLTPESYATLIRASPSLMFDYVLPELFTEHTLPVLNSLEYESDVLEDFKQKNAEIDIIKSAIIKNIPIDLLGKALTNAPYSDKKEGSDILTDQITNDTAVVEEVDIKQFYWRFVLELFSRSLLVDYPQVVTGVHYLVDHKAVAYNLISQVMSRREFIRHCLNYYRLDGLIEATIDTPYVQLRVELLVLTHQYIQATQLLLSSSILESQAFDHFERVVPELGSAELQKLSLILKEHIRYLAELNTQRLQDLLSRYFLEEETLFIDQLSPYPELQLQLIHQILKRHTDPTASSSFMQEERYSLLRIRYLGLLALLGRYQQVQNEIQTNLYPLDESLEICIKYELHSAEAYLYDRLGDIEKAVRTRFLIVNRWLDTLDMQNQDKPNLARLIFQGINAQLGWCVKGCRSVNQPGQYEYEKHWFMVIQELQKLKLQQRQHCFLIRQVINQQVYPLLFQDVVTHVHLHSILRFIENNMNKLEFVTIRESFSLLVKGYFYEKDMLFKCRQLVIEDSDNMRHELLREYSRGMRAMCRCDVCGGTEDVVIRYPCTHQIHPYCSKDIKMCGICKQNDRSFQILQMVNKQDVKFDLLVTPKEEQEVRAVLKPREMRRQKLIHYDYAYRDELTEDMRLQISHR